MGLEIMGEAGGEAKAETWGPPEGRPGEGGASPGGAGSAGWGLGPGAEEGLAWGGGWLGACYE